MALPDIEKILAALDRVQDAVVKPRRLRCVPAIPTTSVGKRDRVAILELLAVPTREPAGK